MKIFNVIAFTLIAMINSTVFAENEQKQESTAAATEVSATNSDSNSGTVKDSTEFQKIVDEYKKYASKIPADVREEIITYRKEIAKINKQKRVLYKKLSQAGQDYLKTEREYKKKLPINRKSLLNLDQ